MIGVSRQAIVHYNHGRNPILPNASLRQRLRLLAVIQIFSAGAFILNLSAMILLYLNINDAGSWLFSAPSFL